MYTGDIPIMAREIQYPVTYIVASNAAKAHRDKYIFWKKLEYFAIVTAAGLAVLPSDPSADYNISALFSGIALSLAIIVLFIEKILAHREGWFKCRALTEAVKAESWKFRSANSTYSQDKNDSEVISSFISFLSSVRNSLHVSKHVAGFNMDGDEITKEMLTSRQANLSERASVYRSERIIDQVKWYSKKANSAKINFNRFFTATFFALLLGIIFASVQFFGYLQNYSLIGLFAALATTMSGWNQVRRYETLAITYTKAAEELRSISQITSEVKNDSELDNVVEDSEAVISKEHTIWVQKSEFI
ncbi:MAG: hypothetical protein BBJ57_06320 [Desulfobacterales bacterium PC51MH44]|nr:MAG: hypothetical protein BBJ57_06320 [Desulfobacterales bacterium PC51MH44]